MTRLFIILFAAFVLQGCDDGDIIITTFNFENADLKTCGGVGNYVFYKENSEAFESLSLRLGTTDRIYETEGLKTYELSNNTSFVNYRSYDGPLGANYFCSSIPPTAPNVASNYLAVSGTVQVIVTFKEDNPVPKGFKKESLSTLNRNVSSAPENHSYKRTIKKDVQIILKDLVLISGEDQIIQETLDMGTIENVEVVETNP